MPELTGRNSGVIKVSHLLLTLPIWISDILPQHHIIDVRWQDALQHLHLNENHNYRSNYTGRTPDWTISPPVIQSDTTVLCFVSVLLCGAALAATRSLRASIQLPLVGSIKFILSYANSKTRQPIQTR